MSGHGGGLGAVACVVGLVQAGIGGIASVSWLGAPLDVWSGLEALGQAVMAGLGAGAGYGGWRLLRGDGAGWLARIVPLALAGTLGIGLMGLPLLRVAQTLVSPLPTPGGWHSTVYVFPISFWAGGEFATLAFAGAWFGVLRVVRRFERREASA